MNSGALEIIAMSAICVALSSCHIAQYGLPPAQPVFVHWTRDSVDIPETLYIMQTNDTVVVYKQFPEGTSRRLP